MTVTGSHLVLAAGTITAANEAFFAPAAGDKGVSFNWRVIPATAIAALLVAGLDQLSEGFGRSIGAMAIITVLFAKLGNAESPITNLSIALGYAKK